MLSTVWNVWLTLEATSHSPAVAPKYTAVCVNRAAGIWEAN